MRINTFRGDSLGKFLGEAMCTQQSKNDFVCVGPFISTEDKLHLQTLKKSFEVGTRLSRRPASHILGLVAEAGESGSVAEGVTPEMIGAAIRRLVRNYTRDESWLPRLMKGITG